VKGFYKAIGKSEWYDYI